jgi:hypothetical protein
MRSAIVRPPVTQTIIENNANAGRGLFLNRKLQIMPNDKCVTYWRMVMHKIKAIIPTSQPNIFMRATAIIIHWIIEKKLKPIAYGNVLCL